MSETTKLNSIYDLFLNQVNRNPLHPAIIENNKTISYIELQEKVDKLTALIAINCNLSATKAIAIALPPSQEFVVSTLACLKLGIPYIPINITHPDEYLSGIMADAKIEFILTNTSQKEREIFNNNQIINFDELEKVTINNIFLPKTSLENDAYIIYTSGSTGAPKGVVIPQKNILNLMLSTQRIYHISSQDSIPLFHSISFDFSVWEIYSALFNGATLVIANEGIKNSIQDYLDFLCQNDITIINLTPSVYYYLITELERDNKNLKLRLIILGGDIFHAIKAKNWFKLPISNQADVYNMYGITEGTIHVTSIKLTQDMTRSPLSFIGTELDGVEITIANDSDKPSLTESTEGELCIGGLALAANYFNQPELNKKSFFISEGKRWFKTGDFVRKTENGLIFIGRHDQQTKIRGFRVNCSEVEILLMSLPGVEDAVVQYFNTAGDDKRLVAFLKNSMEELNIESIKLNIREKLPSFMIPTRFVVQKQFPLTANNKIDYAMLMETLSIPKNKLSNLKNLSVENTILAGWRTVLGTNEIDPTDNFFDAGGDSLLLIKLQYHLQRSLNRNINMTDLLRYPNIKSFANFMREVTS